MKLWGIFLWSCCLGAVVMELVKLLFGGCCCEAVMNLLKVLLRIRCRRAAVKSYCCCEGCGAIGESCWFDVGLLLSLLMTSC